MAGTNFISPFGFRPYQNSSVTPTHFVYIWGKWKCCDWNSNIIEHSMTSPPWYQKPGYPLSHWQLFGPKRLSDNDDFFTTRPSVIDICQILYVYHAIKGNLSHVCSPASRCSYLQLSAFICTCHGFVLVHSAASDPPKVNSLKKKQTSKSVSMFVHINRGKEVDISGSESKIGFTKPDFWSCEEATPKASLRLHSRSALST